MHDNKSQWFIQVFCGVLTAFALFILMPAMVFAEDEQQEYVQESGQDVPDCRCSQTAWHRPPPLHPWAPTHSLFLSSWP